MSYQEKRTIVSILSGAAILSAYCIYAFNRYAAGLVAAGDLKFWAVTMLVFIGIGIVASIIIQIVFHILMSIVIAASKKIQDESANDKDIEKSIEAEMVEDERDRLIELKSARVGFFFAGFGFIAALLSVVLNYSPAVMLNILFVTFSAGALLEGIAQLYFYRKGVQHA